VGVQGIEEATKSWLAHLVRRSNGVFFHERVDTMKAFLAFLPVIAIGAGACSAPAAESTEEQSQAVTFSCTPGTGWGGCQHQFIRFSYDDVVDGAAPRWSAGDFVKRDVYLEHASETNYLSDPYVKWDFVGNSNGYKITDAGTNTICIAIRGAISPILGTINCASECNLTGNSCLWKFTGNPAVATKLQNANQTGKCIGPDPAYNSDQMHETNCSSAAKWVTFFLDYYLP
jgi:hypothetical protein